MKKQLRITALFLLLAACSTPAPPPEATEVPAPTAEATTLPTALPTTAPQPTSLPTDVPAEPTAEPEPDHTLVAPLDPEDAFTRAAVSAAEQATFELFNITNYAANDPVQLAIDIGGRPVPEPPPTEPETFNEGALKSFWIHNTDTQEWSQIEARLERITEHAYFWFDTDRELSDPTAIDRAAQGFEDFYVETTAIYGSEPSPGIDGDPRIHIVHASALALCNVDESTAHNCGLLGYFSTTDTKPAEVDDHSNEHEMFVLNIDRAIGGQGYLSTLVHEFRHMIEHNYDRHDDDWEVEGTATLAQLLVGDTAGPKGRADTYMANTDLQMNAWTQGNSNPHYGKGYVLARYILDRFGLDFYSAWVQHPDRAFFAIDAVLDTFGFDFSAEDLWVDFGAAVALVDVDRTLVPIEFAFSETFESASAKSAPINKFPSLIEDTVSQYGIDIYDIRGNAPVQLTFNGTTKVAVMENVVPASGEYMWWSGRANQSDMSLTREFDLTSVDTATLEFATRYSIEGGWDFGYLLVSTDDGATWTPLVTENMQGEKAKDDPGDLALTERFYTGRAREWLQESVDLSDYAGQVIQIRFQYVTDAIFTAPGMAVDNIAIPEIEFYDDVETLDAGWVAEGFIRVTAYVPPGISGEFDHVWTRWRRHCTAH